MTQQYPETAIADITSFRDSGWKTAIDLSGTEVYDSMWRSLSRAAKLAIDRGKSSQGKVLWLLADACSMRLRPDSANEPFEAMILRPEGRTSLADDFLEHDIAFFAQISDEVDNPWLQARLADLVWLLGKPKNSKFALIAIDAYRKVPLDFAIWLRGGRECWMRAINLSRTLRKSGHDRLLEIEEYILNIFNTLDDSHGFFALWLSEILLDNRLGADRATEIAEKIKALAFKFDSIGDSSRAYDYLSASARWFKRAKDGKRVAEVTVLAAEQLAKQANAQIRHMAAVGLYEKAIQVYRTIPKTERVFHNVEDRLKKIFRLLREAGEGSIGEMGVLEHPPVSIVEVAENARKYVADKSASEALHALANINRGFQVERMREQAEETIKRHLVLALFPATYFSQDGRVIGKLSGIGSGADDARALIWAEMIRNFEMEVQFTVQAIIWPALAAVTLEHRLQVSDFVSLARRSPIVPTGREHLFGKALFYGYEGKFSEALNLISPQFENMVRWHLKAVGATTTSVDKAGINNEVGLSALMCLPEVEEIFDKDFAFEIRALFCEPIGPNLRNKVAHGLLDDNDCESVTASYAWWLGLRVVINGLLNSLRYGDVREDVEDKKEGSGSEQDRRKSDPPADLLSPTGWW